MKPIGLLMREHRMIERMFALLEKENNVIKISGKINIDVLTFGVDFFRTYSDKNHHGKEEDILFRELYTKPLSIELRRTISLLVDDHIVARTMIRALDASRERYVHNSPGAMVEITENIERMKTLYAKHIETEEKHFFYPAMDYFSEEEQEQMLRDFFEFEKTINKEKYEDMVK